MKFVFLLPILFAAPLVAQPAISTIEPASGPTEGGTFVHISGSDLTGLPLACPALACSNYVQFGGVPGSISVNSDTEIVAVAPPHASGSVDLIVNIAGKAMITVPAAFRYQSPAADDKERILLPIVATAAPGAYASSWKSEVTFHNASADVIPVDAPNCNPILAAPCPPPLTLMPGATVMPAFYPKLDGGTGVFVTLPRKDAADVDISIRVQDISRQAQSWGASIPVVRPGDFQSAVRLNNIPTDSRFRATLRVYGWGGDADPIALRVFDPGSTNPIVDVRLDLGASSYASFYPAFLQISSLTDAFPQIRTPLVRVEVESPSIPARPLWAFVSVTNNDTQEVTVIAPSPTARP